MKKRALIIFLGICLIFSFFSCDILLLPSKSPDVEPKPENPSGTNPTISDSEAGKNEITVMIDAGHGDLDSGAVGYYSGNTYFEKDINLSVSLFLRDELLSRGYKVEMIREADTSLLQNYDNIKEVVARRELGLSRSADVYISLHCNSYAGTSRAYGPIIFYTKKADYKSEEMANELKNAITEGMLSFPDTRACRMILDDDYAVLKIREMPTFLIEMGFMTDESDMRQLSNGDWQRALASSVADGIDRFFEQKYIKGE